MERIPLENGRFLVNMSSEEITRLNECTRMAVQSGVNCVNVLKKQKRKRELSPKELSRATKAAIELTVRAAKIIANKP
jgi:hypothetical protein